MAVDAEDGRVWRALPKPADEEAMDGYLKTLYYDTKSAAAFGAASTLYNAVRSEGRYKITLAAVKEWLRKQKAYAFYRKAKKRFTRERVVVSSKNQQWDCDSLSMAFYKKENEGYGYILVCVDIFTRFLHTRPLKTLRAAEAKEAFQDILKTSQKPKSIRTDRGGEFIGSEMKKFLQSSGIKHILTNNELKSSYAERVNRTLRSRIARLIRGKNSFDWLTYLQDLTTAYNNTKHRSIKTTPTIAMRDMASSLLWRRQYLDPPLVTGRFRTEFALAVGDRVRASYLTGPFHRNHDENWTKEIFTVTHRRLNQGFQKYRVREQNSTPVEGEFYEEELMKTEDGGEAYEYEVDQELDSRMVGRGANRHRELLVSWIGWSKKYNSWVPERDLVDVV
jgi:transposase InsO family protein